MRTLLIYTIVIMSVITFLLFGIDKRRARKNQWRIPETTLLLFSLAFGSPGGLLGMIVFHHKVRKWKFRILVPFCILLQILFLAFVLQRPGV